MLKYMRKSMANRIVLIISFIFMMTIFAIGLMTFNVTYKAMTDNRVRETALKAASISKDVQAIFENAKIVTQQLALHPEVQAYLRAAVDRKTVTENPYYKETLNTLVQTKESGDIYFLAWVANEKANFYLDSSGTIPDESYDVKKRPWYAVGMNAKTSAFTPPYVEWGTNRVVISCVRPMRENGETYGFVVMDIRLDNLPVIFNQARINETDKSFLISENGDYLYHEQPEKIMTTGIQDPADELNPYADWIKTDSAGLREILYQGKHYYLEVYEVGENGWKVVSLIDQAAIQREIQSFAIGLVTLLSVIFIATLCVVYWSVKRAMRPYQEVLHFARDIADGDFSQNIPEDYVSRADEMGTLSRSFQIIIDAFRSENVILEQKIIEKNQELENQYAFILEAEKAASLGHLVAGVAHEINTPVGVSLTTASYLNQVNDENRKLLSEGKMNKTQLMELMSIIDESVRLLNANLTRAADLVKSFKQLAVDQSSGALARFDLKESLDGIVLSLLHEYKNMPVQIENRCPSGITLQSFPGAVSQIFTNLIMNSLHHGFKGRNAGKILIETQLKGETVQIVYSDDGMGISKENLKRIYEPFFTTNRHNGNSGLGMHIVMSLVNQKLRGSIRCDSQPDQGVRFTMEIPISLAEKTEA